MLPEPQLRNVIGQLTPRTTHGPYSRYVGYHHLAPRHGGVSSAVGPQPLWGMGSRNSGGRFTPPDTFETVYLAEDPTTAWAEVTGVILHPQAPPLTLRAAPWVAITVDGVLATVLDLAEPSVQTALGTNMQELTGQWRYTKAQGREACTQRLGRICHGTARFDAIRYPSSKNPNGICVAVFPDRLKGPAYLEVYDPHGNLSQRLP
jgi:RES domain-containing protein